MRHRVEGRVMLDSTPMKTEVRIHPDDGEIVSAESDESGGFKFGGVRSGRYRITVHPNPYTILERYADPDLTPLVAPIAGDVEHMRLQVYKGTKKP